MKRRDNLFAISMELLIVLVTLGILEPIKKVDFRYPHQIGAEGKINGYFRVKLLPNIVWMHIQNGYGILINEYVETQSGRCVNLVNELSQHYWYIENRTGIIKSYALSNRALYRCIESIIVYDDIKKKMKRYFEVHHKWWKWCNTQEAMTVVCYKKHQYFHNYVNSRKSHQKGVVICDVKEFLGWINVIASENAKVKNQPM